MRDNGGVEIRQGFRAVGEVQRREIHSGGGTSGSSELKVAYLLEAQQPVFAVRLCFSAWRFPGNELMLCLVDKSDSDVSVVYNNG